MGCFFQLTHASITEHLFKYVITLFLCDTSAVIYDTTHQRAVTFYAECTCLMQLDTTAVHKVLQAI